MNPCWIVLICDFVVRTFVNLKKNNGSKKIDFDFVLPYYSYPWIFLQDKILFSDVWKRKFVARISTRIWIETKVSLRGPMNNIKRLCQDIIVQKYYGIEKLISFYGIITKKDGDINQMVIEARKIIKREAEFDKFKYFEKIIDQIKWNNTVNLNKILRYEFDCDKDEFMLIDKCQYLGNNEIFLELNKSSIPKNLVTYLTRTHHRVKS